MLGAIVVVTVGCSAPTRPTTPTFVLCQGDAQGYWTTQIDFATGMGLYTDFGRAIEFCGGKSSRCLEFPLIFSAPPRLPSGSGDVVEWRVGDKNFTARGSDGQRLEIVAEFPATIAGRHLRRRSTYLYDKTEGVLEEHADLGDGSWRRCGGKLTFADIEYLQRTFDKR